MLASRSPILQAVIRRDRIGLQPVSQTFQPAGETEIAGVSQNVPRHLAPPHITHYITRYLILDASMRKRNQAIWDGL